MRSKQAQSIALGGMMAAVAVVIMCLGGFIPIATYVCPMICCITQFLVLLFTTRRIAWSWFAVVSVLSLLISPNKEAVMIFIALGYYPMLKSVFEKWKIGIILKFLFFNCAIATAYGVMIYLLGMQEVAAENQELGIIGLIIMLFLGNVTFFLLDRFLIILGGKLK